MHVAVGGTLTLCIRLLRYAPAYSNSHNVYDWPPGGKPSRDRAEGFQLALTSKLLRQLSLTDRQTSITDQDDEEFDKWGYFAYLPVRKSQYSCEHDTIRMVYTGLPS